jgi:hypothetical protein
MCLAPRDRSIVRGSWSCCVAQVQTYSIVVAVCGALKKMLLEKHNFVDIYFLSTHKKPDLNYVLYGRFREPSVEVFGFCLVQ